MKKLRGSIVLEASLVLPMFLFVVIAFLSLFQWVGIRMEVHSILDSGLEQLTGYESFLNDKELTNDVFINLYMQTMLSDTNTSGFAMGENAILCTTDTIENDKKKEIAASASFLYKIPFPFGIPIRIPTTVKSQRVVWIGEDVIHSSYAKEEESEQFEGTVFVTRYGSVYHIDQKCSVLYRDIKEVSPTEIISIRNMDGARYYECELCNDTSAMNYFVTQRGERYHMSDTCHVLLRYIEEVEFHSIKGMSKCFYCEKKE